MFLNIDENHRETQKNHVFTTYSNKVWVINRSVNALGVQLGLMKVKFNKLIDNRFHFAYSKMDNSELNSAIVDP